MNKLSKSTVFLKLIELFIKSQQDKQKYKNEEFIC